MIPHHVVKSVLYSTELNEFKIFEDENENQFTVSAIQMFKENIIPAWEDPVNKEGSEYRIDINKHVPDDVVQDIWNTLIFDMILGKMPHIIDGIAGVRLV